MNEKIEELYKVNECATRFYRHNLATSKIVHEYLIKRNITRKSVNKFSLGYSTNDWDGFYNYGRKHFSDYLLEEAGLIIKKETQEGYYDRFKNRLMFPIFNSSGRVCGFGGRVLDNSKPKYLNSPETLVYSKSSILYGWNFAKESVLEKNQVIIVEGFLDCLMCHQYGIINTVATLGTSLTKEQSQFIKRYTDNVIISYDTDSAGVQASIRSFKILIKEELNVKVATMPEGKDPDELLNKKGKDVFLDSIKNAKSMDEFDLTERRR
jgi:DNA primase